MQLLYLPPYSPNFNPIEEGFSAMKAWLRNNCDSALINLTRGLPTSMAPSRLLWNAVYESMTPDNIWGWFADCGYVV